MGRSGVARWPRGAPCGLLQYLLDASDTMPSRLTDLASLLRARNAIAAKITAISGRPASLGHLGEFIAAEVFGIDLESSASNRGHDGRFRSGALQGRTVNVKW